MNDNTKSNYRPRCGIKQHNLYIIIMFQLYKVQGIFRANNNHGLT